MKLLDVTDPLLHHLQKEKEKETKKLEKRKEKEVTASMFTLESLATSETLFTLLPPLLVLLLTYR